MRAKITKTVDIGDIPAESRKMIDQVKNVLVYYMPEKMSEIVKYSLSNNAEEYFHATELIRLFREHLKNYDESLQEIENIMLGYKDYVYKKAEEQQQEHHQQAQQQTEQQASEVSESFKKKQESDKKMMEKIDSFLKDISPAPERDAEWAANEQAEYEKFMSRVMDAEDGHEPAEDEEG